MKDVSGLMNGIAKAVPEEAEAPAEAPQDVSRFNIASELDEMPTKKEEIDDDLSGDPSVMQSNPRNASQTVAAIYSGDPAGLEGMWFGSTEDGTPSISYIDDYGELQVHRVTPAHWLAAKEARGLNRIKATERQNEMQELEEKKTELRPTFEDGLDSVDDEAYRALLQQMFEDDPQRAVRELVADRRGSSMDEEKNQAKRDALKNEQAWETSKRVQNQNINESNQARADNERERQQLITTTGDATAAIAQNRSQQREISLRETAMAYAPSPNNATASPSEAMNPRQFKDALRAWLPMVERMIPHPSNPNYDAAMEDLFGALNGIARDIGWQKGITERDLGAVEQAVNDYLGVHGEAVEIQNLTKENEALQKVIDEMKAKQVNVAPAQQMAESQRADISQRQTSLDTIRAKDTNRDGVVSAEEEAKFEQDVSTLESGRDVYQGTASAKFAAEQKTKREEDAKSASTANKRMVGVQSDMTELMDGTDDESGIEELREMKEKYGLTKAMEKVFDRKERLYAKLQKEWRSEMWTQTEQDEYVVKWYVHLGITKEEFKELYEKGDKRIKEASLKIENYEDPPAPPTPASP